MTLGTGDIRWLFEKRVYEDGNPTRMAEIVRAKGMTLTEATFVSVEGQDDELRALEPIPFADDDPVFAYGSMNLMQWLRNKGKWRLLAWYDFPKLRCQSYYAHWGQFLLQQHYAFLPLAEVHRRRDWLYRTFGKEGRIFIRPDDNAKSFAGGVVDEAEFENWWELANFYDPGPECLAVVAPPQVLHAEWRLLICNKKVITGSQYRCKGKEAITAGYPPDVAAFAKQVVNTGTFEPHPVYVMDVCQTNVGCWLVEIGSVCCASLYGCDLALVVDAVKAGAEREIFR